MDQSLPGRFWSKVDRNGPTMPGVDTRCWEWTGGKDASGYGKFYWEGRTMGSFTGLLFFWLMGKSLQSCAINAEIPSCVRPDHLYAGDVESNSY